MNLKKLLAELQRRNVYRAAVVYTMTSWLLIQVATQVFPFFAIPDWIVGIGFLDDAYVLGMAVKAVKKELDAFLAWEAAG